MLPNGIGLNVETELGGDAFGFFLVGVLIEGIDGTEIFRLGRRRFSEKLQDGLEVSLRELGIMYF